MKTTSLVVLFSLLSFTSSEAFQQNISRDRVWLRNTSIMRAAARIFIPGERSETLVGNQDDFISDINDISRMKKADDLLYLKTDLSSSRQNPYRKHMLISAVGFGATWCATLIGSSAWGDEYKGTTLIPMIGPFLSLSEYSSKYSPQYLLPIQKGLLIASGVAQTGFFIYFIWAWMNKQGYDHKFSIAPSSNSTGITLTYRF